MPTNGIRCFFEPECVSPKSPPTWEFIDDIDRKKKDTTEFVPYCPERLSKDFGWLDNISPIKVKAQREIIPLRYPYPFTTK